MSRALKISIISVGLNLAAGSQSLNFAAGTVHGVSLRIAATKKAWRPGAAIPVRATFVNNGKLPFVFTQEYSARYTFLFQGGFRPHGPPLRTTRFAKRWQGMGGVNFHWLPPVQVVAIGKEAVYRCAPMGGGLIFAGRYLDLTLPGKYRVRLRTKYGMRKFAGGGPYSTTAGWGKIGPSFRLNQDMVIRPPHGKRVVSNWIHITVRPPYAKRPGRALKMLAAPERGARAVRGIALVLMHPRIFGTVLASIRAEVLNQDKQSQALRLTGDPLEDFARIEVTGPSYTGEVRLVKKPMPHYVPFIRKTPAPLTAYGQWLAKHPVKGLNWKKYTLKPKVVYKYAVPINLSCMYDMSLPGVYHVRVELAHTHLWSPWANLTVPQN